jgi:hypothetical protein
MRSCSMFSAVLDVLASFILLIVRATAVVVETPPANDENVAKQPIE